MDASILIPVYNGEKYIEECLVSVLKSDFTGSYEIVIVNDGSTDATESIIKLFQSADHRIKIVSQKNSGIEEALNLGLEHCTGDIILRLDADDIMVDDRISSQVAILKNDTDLDWISGRATIIDWQSHELVATWTPPSDDFIFRVIDKYCYIIHPTVAIRRQVLLNAGGYIKGIRYKEDVDLWKRLHSAGAKYKFIDKIFIKYRISNSSIRAVSERHAEKKLIRLLIYYGRRTKVFKYLFQLPVSQWFRFLFMLILPTNYWSKKILKYDDK